MNNNIHYLFIMEKKEKKMLELMLLKFLENQSTFSRQKVDLIETQRYFVMKKDQLGSVS